MRLPIFKKTKPQHTKCALRLAHFVLCIHLNRSDSACLDIAVRTGVLNSRKYNYSMKERRGKHPVNNQSCSLLFVLRLNFSADSFCIASPC